MRAFIKLATRAAERSSYKYQMGAVLSVKGIPVEVGCNSLRHQNVLKTNHWQGSMHAEIQVISRMIRTGRKDMLVGSSLYVVRLSRAGGLAMAMPCVDCMEIMLACGVKRCYYSNSDGLISEIRL